MHKHIFEKQKEFNERLLKSYGNQSIEDLFKSEEVQETEKELDFEDEEIEKSDISFLGQILKDVDFLETLEFAKSEQADEPIEISELKDKIVKDFNNFNIQIKDKYIVKSEGEYSVEQNKQFINVKTALDSCHDVIVKSGISNINLALHNGYNQRAAEFNKHFGFKHNSDEAKIQLSKSINGLNDYLAEKVNLFFFVNNVEKSESDDLIKARGQVTPIGQIDKAGRYIKTADGWKPVKTHGHLAKKDDSAPSGKTLHEPEKKPKYEEGDEDHVRDHYENAHKKHGDHDKAVEETSKHFTKEFNPEYDKEYVERVVGDSKKESSNKQSGKDKFAAFVKENVKLLTTKNPNTVNLFNKMLSGSGFKIESDKGFHLIDEKTGEKIMTEKNLSAIGVKIKTMANDHDEIGKKGTEAWNKMDVKTRAAILTKMGLHSTSATIAAGKDLVTVMNQLSGSNAKQLAKQLANQTQQKIEPKKQESKIEDQAKAKKSYDLAIDQVGEALADSKFNKEKYSADTVEALRHAAKRHGALLGLSNKEIDNAIVEARSKAEAKREKETPKKSGGKISQEEIRSLSKDLQSRLGSDGSRDLGGRMWLQYYADIDHRSDIPKVNVAIDSKKGRPIDLVNKVMSYKPSLPSGYEYTGNVILWGKEMSPDEFKKRIRDDDYYSEYQESEYTSSVSFSIRKK